MSLLWDIGVPLVVLGGAALVLPLVFVPRGTRSQGQVAVGIAISAGIMIFLGAILYLIFDSRSFGEGIELLGLTGLAALAVQGSIKGVLFWAPFLALRWMTLAQRVELLRCQDMVREGMG